MSEPIPIYRYERDGEWITRICRCGERFPRYRRELTYDKRLARLHRCPRPRSAA